jgi:hypothetical protein
LVAFVFIPLFHHRRRGFLPAVAELGAGSAELIIDMLVLHELRWFFNPLLFSFSVCFGMV